MIRVTLGLGCDRGVSIQTLEEAVQHALMAANLTLDAIDAAGTIDKKCDEPAILSLTQHHGWSLRFFSPETLSTVKVPSPSQTVQRHMGTPAVAEAAALLAGNAPASDLLLAKYKFKGSDGKNATVAIARSRPGTPPVRP